MSEKRDLSLFQLVNLSFGFFGVQTAYALQNNSNSRIFESLGADPHSLSYFWILPPLMGLIVQPIIGSMSDKTWNRFGRRIPYLLFGAILAIIVMFFFPYSGSIGFTSISAALLFGAVCLMLLDTSLNIAMQPFKMMVGDMVNEKQKTKAYSIQSLLCNAGSLVGYLFPFALAALGVSNVAQNNEVAPNVVYSFWICAAILIACVIYTVVTVKEMPPKEYAEFHGISSDQKKTEKTNPIKLLKNAPATFWTVGIVQFFCWSAFMYMWIYSTGAVTALLVPETTMSSGDFAKMVEGVMAEFSLSSGDLTKVIESVVTEAKVLVGDAADWVGICFAVQAVGSMLWAMVLPRFKKIKLGYVISLIIGAIGFGSIMFLHNKYALCGAYFLVGTAWAAMLAYPFTLLTNSLEGNPRMGSYLGLFNGTICLPQIIAGLLGGAILYIVGGARQNMLMVSAVLLILGAFSVGLIKTNNRNK